MSAIPHPIRLPSIVRRRRREESLPLFADIHEMVETLRWFKQRQEAPRD